MGFDKGTKKKSVGEKKTCLSSYGVCMLVKTSQNPVKILPMLLFDNKELYKGH